MANELLKIAVSPFPPREARSAVLIGASKVSHWNKTTDKLTKAEVQKRSNDILLVPNEVASSACKVIARIALIVWEIRQGPRMMATRPRDRSAKNNANRSVLRRCTGLYWNFLSRFRPGAGKKIETDSMEIFI
jgi:hypothetical protein